jgi:hypothetical protein
MLPSRPATATAASSRRIGSRSSSVPPPPSQTGFLHRALLLLVPHHGFQRGPQKEYRVHGNEKEMDRVRWGADGRITSRGALGLDRSAASRPDPSRLSLPSVGFPLLACATRRNNRRLCFFCGGYNDGGDPMFLLSLLAYGFDIVL